jgi:hypothetical protein
VEIEEIHDVAPLEPVPEIAKRAAEHQRERGTQQPVAGVANDQHADDDRGDGRDRRKDRRLPSGRAGEEAERGALVEHQHQVEESVSWRRSPGAKASSTTSLVTRSAAMIAAATANQGSTSSVARAGLRMRSRLAGPEQVADAAAAQSRMLGVRADFLAVVPAALAFRVGARRRHARASDDRVTRGRRGQQHVLQVSPRLASRS